MTYSRWTFTSSRMVKPCATPEWATKNSTPELQPVAAALRIRSKDGVRLLHTARMAYDAGDDWMAQRYLFAAMVKGHPLALRPGPARLTKAEQTLKKLL